MVPEENEAEESGRSLALSLSESERKVLSVLRAAGGGPKTDDEVARLGELVPETARGSLQRLRSKGLALVDEEHRTTPRLTRKGQDAVDRGLPERRLLKMIQASSGPVPPEALLAAGFTEEERSAAIGTLRRAGFLAAGVPFTLEAGRTPAEAKFPEEEVLEAVARGTRIDPETPALRSMLRRGLVTLEHTTVRKWTPSEEGRSLALEGPQTPLVGMLTPAILASGGWQDRSFRPYDVRAAVPFVYGARTHPYLEWLSEFEEILLGLGFEEAEGPVVETEFWNADVLFMPQDHPARSIHDMLSVDGVQGHLPEAELLERVAAVHEGRPIPPATAPLGPGWRAPYDRSLASRAVARSQTTAVSARFLARHPVAPFRMYSIGRNFRYEAVDATHHIEFDQCEGILGDYGVNLRHLVGLFSAVAKAVRIPELRFRPSYFPFTEPSIEGYARHPRLGWIEVFPGGMFRPEVTRPLGIDVPVAAWGIGITRLAMVSLGVADIRDLFLDDLAQLTSGTG